MVNASCRTSIESYNIYFQSMYSVSFLFRRSLLFFCVRHLPLDRNGGSSHFAHPSVEGVGNNLHQFWAQMR
jgi:hypothetical protein